MTAFCLHCDSDLGGYLVLTSDGHSFRSYGCREHGDVVPMDDGYGEREQGNLSDVQDCVPGSSEKAAILGKAVLPEMPSKA